VFYGNCTDTFFAVIKDGFKYNWARYGDEELLFNMADDPLEQHDLSKIKPELAAEMKRLLTDKMRQCNPKLVSGGKLVPLPPITSPSDVPKWPGLHSTLFPSDVLH